MIDIEVLRKVQKSLSRYIFAKEYLSWNGIRKACNNIILSIPAELADPVMIFKSRTRDDSFVFFTEQKDENDRTVLIPLAVNKKKGRIYINEVTSMYGRNNEIDFVKSNVDEDKLVYLDKTRTHKWIKQQLINEKSLDGVRAFKVQFLEQRLTDIETYNPSILTKDKLVKFITSGINTSIQKNNSCKKTGVRYVVRGQHSSVAESQRKHRSGYL